MNRITNQRGRPRRNRLHRSRYLFSYSVLLPILLLFFITRILPISRTFWLSFTNWRLTSKTYALVGAANYARMWNDIYFWSALRNTTVYSIAVVTLSIVLALPLALLVASRLRFTSVYQTLFFAPYITPLVAMSIAWRWIYDAQYGLLNYLLSLFGIPRIGWLTSPNLALWAVIIMSVWRVLGYNMVILLVGIKNIPRLYFEAASIDGASGWQQFRAITLPLLNPIILFLFITSTINAYNVFTQVYVMTQGTLAAPTEAVRVLVLEIYQNAFHYSRMGYASAEAVVLTLIVLVLTVVQFRVVGTRG